MELILLERSQKEPSLGQPGSELQSPEPSENELIVLNHLVCSTWLRQPQETREGVEEEPSRGWREAGGNPRGSGYVHYLH